MDARDAPAIELCERTGALFADSGAPMQRDEHEKQCGAGGQNDPRARRVLRQRENPRGAEDDDDKRGEPASAEDLAALVRSRCLRVEGAGALLVPTCDVLLVLPDQGLSSFSDC